ncbi:unnamed protein product [Arctogadus glacialis]
MDTIILLIFGKASPSRAGKNRRGSLEVQTAVLKVRAPRGVVKQRENGPGITSASRRILYAQSLPRHSAPFYEVS